MKKIFGTISSIAALLIITRHTAGFVFTYYWLFVAILLIGMAGQLLFSILEKKQIQNQKRI